MLKNFVIALGIAALTSTSAFAAAKAPKITPAPHKVAQVAATKPEASKAKQEDSKAKPEAGKAKQDKKVKKVTKAAEPAAAEPAKK